jgi:hypothetical protein
MKPRSSRISIDTRESWVRFPDREHGTCSSRIFLCAFSLVFSSLAYTLVCVNPFLTRPWHSARLKMNLGCLSACIPSRCILETRTCVSKPFFWRWGVRGVGFDSHKQLDQSVVPILKPELLVERPIVPLLTCSIDTQALLVSMADISRVPEDLGVCVFYSELNEDHQ